MAQQIEQAAGSTALLIVDMMNALDFDGADRLKPAALAAARATLRLRDEADAQGVPVVYINDNYGYWHSEQSRIVDHVEQADGRELVELLRPRDTDYFIIKPQFSGFYATNLPVLLPKLGASRIVLTGLAADICVLFTAADAHMREYDLWVPGDTVASADSQRTRWALDIMAQSMKAETRTTEELQLKDWLAQAD
ncbi:cysteine hydrolase family protein [Sphingomonas jatrophae]|nr:isochorismatase family cysteine hydrolase [Sphingomonas jatrophae]